MTNEAVKSIRIDQAMMHRCLPFAIFMGFIGLDELIRLLGTWHLFAIPADAVLYYLYPVKAVTVAAVLLLFRKSYSELNLKDLFRSHTVAVCLIGLVTFVIWISLDGVFALAGSPGFNPNLLPEGPIRILMTATRVLGAVVVVPLMEELFWRSFLLRYLIAPRFDSVPIGRFTWPSFVLTSILFGLEHHLIAAGIVTGAIYNGILYKTRSIAQCVLAHAVTNLALAIYVLSTGKWYLW